MFKILHKTFRDTIVICVACMSLCFFSLDSHAAFSVLSDFEIGSEGWSVADWNPDLSAIVDNFSITWHANGGNPGGYISSTDPSGNWFWFAAPAKFLGNQAASYGYSLQFDLFDQYSNDPSGELIPLVILSGAGQRAYFLGEEPNTTFTSYTVLLEPTGWVLNDYVSGVDPTIAEMQTILGDLDGIYIDGDWAWNDYSGLDNVRLNTVPVPGSLFLLSSGIAMLAGTRIRRKRK